MRDQKQEVIIRLISQLIEKSIYEDIIKNDGELKDGESWNTHHLKMVKTLCQEYFNEN